MSIEVRNLFKQFGDKEVLKGIDYTFETGKVNMIIGASGSGKSVLLKNMVGLMFPDQGEVLYNGENMGNMNELQMRTLRRRIGMLFQSAALFDSMTVSQNIAFPLRMFTTKTGREIKARVEELLQRVNMPGTGHLFPSEISGGMRKRVGIARAIALEPEFLFCDEPNSGLDPQTAEVIDNLLRKLTNDLNITTIIVSHDMKSVLTIGDTVLFIYQGHKRWSGTRDEITDAKDRQLLRFIETSGVQLDLETSDIQEDPEPMPSHAEMRRRNDVDPAELGKPGDPHLPPDLADPAAGRG